MSKDKKKIYPLTIVMDRYNGCYSGAKYLAFNLDHHEIPNAIGGGDPDEMCFWDVKEPQDYITHFDYVIGKGNTIQEAFDNLYNIINSDYENKNNRL